MYELPIPSTTDLLIMALIIAAVAIGAWELLQWLVSLVDISVSWA